MKSERADVISRMMVECDCLPCPHCGFKHYCNVAIEHPDGKVRAGRCPAEFIPDPLGEVAGDE